MSLQHGSIESFFLEGEAGRLEAVLNLGLPDAKYACLVCHPHPLFGGTMHNKVVFHAMKALNAFGFPVLRFNFRGAGSSAGEHDYGRGEIADVRVALDYLAGRFIGREEPHPPPKNGRKGRAPSTGKLPIIFAGFSFGAAIGLAAALPDPRVAALIALGLPVNADGREYDYSLLHESEKPKLLLSGGNDEFATEAQLAQVFANAAEPKRLVVIPNADHFFAGHLEEMRSALSGWVQEIVGPTGISAV